MLVLTVNRYIFGETWIQNGKRQQHTKQKYNKNRQQKLSKNNI